MPQASSALLAPEKDLSNANPKDDTLSSQRQLGHGSFRKYATLLYDPRDVRIVRTPKYMG